MIEGLIIGFFVILGLGAWLPIRGIGARLFLGAVLLPLALFVGNTLVRVPLSWCGWAISIASLAGLIKLAKNGPGTSMKKAQLIWHPAIVLPVLIIGVGLWQSELSYLPLNWDEFSSWANWGRQLFAGDTWWRDDISISYRHYTMGWPMVQAFAQTPFQKYDELRAIAYLALFHIALLALLFDTVVLILSQNSALKINHIWALSWVVVLVLVGAEASWKLLPPSLLIERVTLYWSLGLFLLALQAWYSEEARHAMPWVLGIVLASLFTLKTPMASLAIPIVILGLWCWWEDRKTGPNAAASLLKILVLLFLPYLILAGLWYGFSIGGGGGPPIDVSQPIMAWNDIGRLIMRIVSELTAYVSVYKWPLTIIGLVGLATGAVTQAQRPMVFGLIIFILCYWAGLLPVYLYVISGNEVEGLPSLPRYARLCLRLIHFLGFALLLINSINYIGKYATRAPLDGGMKPKVMAAFFGLFAALLLIVQVWMTDRTYKNMQTRDTETPAQIASINQIRRESLQLRELIEKLSLQEPRARLIDYGDLGFRQRVALFYGVNLVRGDNIYAYRLSSKWSFDETGRSEAFLRELLTFKIVWPFRVPPQAKAVLSRLISDPKCAKSPEQFFLVQDAHSRFSCYFKGTNEQR